MQNIQIVVPKPEDTLGITTVFHKAWLSAYPNKEYGITIDDIEDHFKSAFTPEGQEKRRKHITNPAPNSFRLIAKDGDKVVGTATLLRDEEKNKLSTIYVLPEYQGKGIGKMLWLGLKEKLDNTKKTIVQVAVYNKNAIAFYEKLGFKDNGKRWSDEKFRMKSGSILPEMEMDLIGKNNNFWSDYYKITSENPPTKILVEAVSKIDNKGIALELGAGTPKDTRFLLDNGFTVVAVDKDSQSKSFFEQINSDRFTFIQDSFENINYPDNHYDLISAQRSLPFIKEKDVLFKCFADIKLSLKPKGIFVGHFFGINDTWHKEGKVMTFLDRQEVDHLLKDLEIIKLVEKEEDSQTANGTPHHWHVFDVIARKK